MEEKDKESASFDKSAYILTFESFEVSLKREESTSIIDKQPLQSRIPTEKIKSSPSKGGCSKLCTKYRKTNLNGPQTSNWKPQTLRESFYRQKKPETKPVGKMLFDQLKTKMEETSRKLQRAVPFFKKKTRRTIVRARSLCEGLRTKRVLGFKCDLKKCANTLKDCSAGACRKKGMVFGEPSHPCDSKLADSSVSDTLTASSSSEDMF